MCLASLKRIGVDFADAKLRFDFESAMVRLTAVQLSNLTAAWQIRENFSAKPWQLPFSLEPRAASSLP